MSIVSDLLSLKTQKGWLSDFLGVKKLKLPEIGKAEELASMDQFETDSYIKGLEAKSGFTDQIITGNKKPKLANKSYLGAA